MITGISIIGALMNKTTRAQERADAVWQDMQELIWNGCCGKCTKPGGNGHHIITKGSGAKSLRYEVFNGIFLCAACHTQAHLNGSEFMDWLLKKYKTHAEFYYDNKSRGAGHSLNVVWYEDRIYEMKQVMEGIKEMRKA
jgi:hypothetical protein